MATQLGRDAAIYWGTGVSPGVIAETRNIALDLGADFADDTVHGDVNRTEAPTYSRFNCSVTGLFDTTDFTIMDGALNKDNGYCYIYFKSDDNTMYWYGRGYVAVDEEGNPYDEFETLNWTFRPSGTMTLVHP